MSDQDAARTEKEMREHEREARERSEVERDATDTGSAINPAPPGNIQTGTNTGS